MQIYILTKTDKWQEGMVEFNHYWNNTEENYPDMTDLESYLDTFFIDENGDRTYDWELKDVRIYREGLESINFEINSEFIDDYKDVFLKLVDGKEIPMYYYNIQVTQVSNQNNEIINYKLVLELDKWSTFGCKMHGHMKNPNMTQNYLCNRKMEDRFDYQYDEQGNLKLGINYLTRPWLLNSGHYNYPLLQATDNLLPGNLNADPTQMNLINWLKMNGCIDTDWSKWIDKDNGGIISYIDCKKTESGDGHTVQQGKDKFTYNSNIVSLAKTDMPLMDDAYYNSNGKYRYFVVKFGSNNAWSYKLNTDKDDPNYDPKKIEAYNRARQDLYWLEDPEDPDSTKHYYEDLQQLLSDVVLGGGGQVITTKKVKGTIEGSTEENMIFLNGESICYIPFPKGQYEELYLHFLNSHDKGIVLGNGSILGMVVNDIPPSVLAAALKKYNNNLEDEKVGEETITEAWERQTIGDKLSYNGVTEGKSEWPFSWTSLKLEGQWDWKPYHEFEAIFNFEEIGSSWKPMPNAWYEAKGDYVLNRQYLRPIHYTNEKEHFYVVIDRWWAGYSSALSRNWNCDGDEPGWDFGELVFKYREKTPTVRKNELEGNGAAYFLHFKGGDTWVKDNWEVISVAPVLNDGERIPYGLEAIKFDYNFPEGETWVLQDHIKRAYETNIIPPIDSKTSHWYHLSTDPKTKLYPAENIEHYFPTIFHDFSSIPVTVARKDNGIIEGQGDWFKVFENMLTNPGTEDIPGYSTNNRWSEPFLWGPQFYQWTYYIDGLNKIILTADQIDWFKIHEPNWNINLNVNMTTTTNLRLDIADIINDNYPFTKSATELVSLDQNAFPFTSEAFNNWYEENAAAENTAKNAKDIRNLYAQKEFNVSGPLNLLTGTTSGAAAGASTGMWQMALAGSAAGLLAGGAAWGVGQAKLNLEIEEANKQWANEWAGNYGNLYAQPTHLNSSGFQSGSLIYNPNGPFKDAFELFRMFTITPEARDAIGEEIFTSGYNYMRECPYNKYENRENFNIVNFNLSEKNAIVNKYLKEKMSQDTLIFSQQEFINWFKAKCMKKIRLFRVPFDVNNMDDLIKTNIELDFPEELLNKKKKEA